MATTRTETPEGFLVAGAVLTRAGEFQYLRGEIGLDGNPSELVTIERTMETLSHPETLASIRRAPITNDHPQGGVSPDNWGETVDGMVVGEPYVQGNAIVSDVLIGDPKALQDLRDGKRELSVGYDFMVNPTQTATVGPLMVNHVALVEKGRAGSSVRVLDTAPVATVGDEPSDDPDAGDEMTADEIAELVDKAADKAADAAMTRYMGEKNGDGDPNATDGRMSRDAMRSVMAEAMAPVAEAMRKMNETNDAAKTAADAETARKRAEDAAAALTEQVRGEERQRFRVLTDAMPLIDDEDKVNALADADAKTILVEALGDTVENAADHTVEFLQGALAVAKANAKNATDRQPNGLPWGVTAFDNNQPGSPGEARAQAVDAFVEAQADAYTKSGGQ